MDGKKKKKSTIVKHKLIVLDIDSVLIDSIRRNKAEKIKTKPSTYWKHGHVDWAVYSRPYLQSFLAFCKQNFEYVGIWTKADKFWANYVIKDIMPKGYPLLFIWTAKHADKYKRLSKVWKEFAHLGINDKNTLIIEDTPENCLMNMNNAIIVNPFLIEHEEDDITFPLLCHYLKHLLKEKNIVSIDKSKWKLEIIEKLMKGKIQLVEKK